MTNEHIKENIITNQIKALLGFFILHYYNHNGQDQGTEKRKRNKGKSGRKLTEREL